MGKKNKRRNIGTLWRTVNSVARVQRMTWLGHVARLNDDIPTKQALMRELLEGEKEADRDHSGYKWWKET
jgi:hypothetical protein